MNYSAEMKKTLSALKVGESANVDKTRPFSKIRVTIYYAAELLDIKVSTTLNADKTVLTIERLT